MKKLDHHFEYFLFDCVSANEPYNHGLLGLTNAVNSTS